MPSQSRSPILDLSICGVLVGLSVFIIWGTKDIPPPFFDPVGSAAFPKYAAYIIIALALAIGVRAIFSIKTTHKETKKPYKEEPLLALYVVVVPSLYVLTMNLGWLSFRAATILFIILLSALLSKFDKRSMIVSAIVALVFGIGGQYLFTEVFYIDLPQ